jgi:aspartyl-tRNA(Asn)/glutamyl-tRNA(Gln) amidotransferase subunit A
MTQAPGTPVFGTLAADLSWLAADPFEGVGIPGARFIGAAPARGASPVQPTPDQDGDGQGGTRGAMPAAGPDAGLREVSASVRAGTLSAATLVASARDRIRTTDAEVRAWVCIHDSAVDLAVARDRDLSDGRWHGPLHGIPVGIKDMIDVAGEPTRAGSAQWVDGQGGGAAHRDADVVALLRQAGAVVLGKTRTHEFAFGGTTPPTRNPVDHTRIPGGSSGGSAAAVAAGHVRVAVGTDTCGSVRIPSSYCGTIGFIPSVGVLPEDGVVPLAWSLDRVGLITATAADLALAAAALGIDGAARPASPDAPDVLSGLRIGVPAGVLDGPIDPAVVEAFDAVQATLRAAGAEIVPAHIAHAASAVTAGVAIFLAESLDYHRDRIRLHPELFGADVQQTLALAAQVSGADYVHAQRARQCLRAEVLAALSGVDLLLTPTMPSGAPEVTQAEAGLLTIDGQQVGLAQAHLRYNVIANLAAVPAGTQPMGRDRWGMPLGVQWIGAPGSDSLLVAAMVALEVRLGLADTSTDAGAG